MVAPRIVPIPQPEPVPPPPVPPPYVDETPPPKLPGLEKGDFLPRVIFDSEPNPPQWMLAGLSRWRSDSAGLTLWNQATAKLSSPRIWWTPVGNREARSAARAEWSPSRTPSASSCWASRCWSLFRVRSFPAMSSRRWRRLRGCRLWPSARCCSTNVCGNCDMFCHTSGAYERGDHQHHHYDHDHSHLARGRSHSGQLSTGLGISGGLVPCPAALVIMPAGHRGRAHLCRLGPSGGFFAGAGGGVDGGWHDRALRPKLAAESRGGRQASRLGAWRRCSRRSSHYVCGIADDGRFPGFLPWGLGPV